jgi:TPR repeat protein
MQNAVSAGDHAMRQTADNGKPIGIKGSDALWFRGRIIYRSGVAAAIFFVLLGIVAITFVSLSISVFFGLLILAAFFYGLGWAIRYRLAGVAQKRYRRAAEQGSTHAQNEFGLIYEESPRVRRDFAEELAWRRKAAEQGYANAQYYLGRKYEIGLGLPQDFAAATEWYVRAAEQGHARAQEGLANMYEEGRCVPTDNATAAYWHRRIAKQKRL